MKKKLVAIFIICTGITFCEAQNKWYVSPTIGVMGLESERWTAMSLNFGREFGDQSIDLVANYAFAANDYIFSTSIIGSWKAPVVGNLWGNLGMGVGVQRIVSMNETEIIVPIRMDIGYTISQKIALGLDVSINSTFRKSTTTYFGGLFLNYRF